MEMRERHFGPLVFPKPDSTLLYVDVGALVRRLLLFEHCIIESDQLKEIPQIVRTFGFNGLMTLLESGAIDIVCDAMTAGQIGQTADLDATRRRGGPLPHGSYLLASVRLSPDEEHRRKYVAASLQSVHEAPITLKQAIKLKSTLAPMLQTYPELAATNGVIDTRNDVLSSRSTVWGAIRRIAQTEYGLDLGDAPRMEVRDLQNDDDFRVETPLAGILGPEPAHALVEKALLGLAGMNIRVHLMKELEAVSGFRNDEFPYFEDKIGFLMRQLEPSTHEERFDRVVAIAELPSLVRLSPDSAVDVKELLRIRDSDECREFRRWLRGVDQETDDEIKVRFDSIRSRAAGLVEGGAGKSVRFALTTAAGFVPGAGIVLGPLASAADSFLLEKVIGRPGPVAFLSRHYRSIFREP